MRILHCCLAVFYIDDYGYQENILPRVHQEQGHEVAILASTETYIENRVLGHVAPRAYTTETGIPIERLAYCRYLPHKLATKLRWYEGLYDAVDAFSPDVIFLHDLQFLGISQIARYAKAHPGVRVYVDGHTDFVNSARNWISRNILHRIIYRHCARLIEPHVRKFWGTFPLRVAFFREMYGLPAEKTDLLVLGAEDSKIHWDRKDQIRGDIRRSLGISADDFVIVAGGKIDRRKNFTSLMRAVARIDRTDVKLVLFGVADEEMESEVRELASHPRIAHVGWIESDRAYDYFLAADVAIFPGTHSVLWEQAVGVGLPCIFRKWPGIQHVDVGGNCLFLDEGSAEEIEESILAILDEEGCLAEMKRIAVERAIPEFSYSEIAKRAIEAVG